MPTQGPSPWSHGPGPHPSFWGPSALCHPHPHKQDRGGGPVLKEDIDLREHLSPRVQTAATGELMGALLGILRAGSQG